MHLRNGNDPASDGNRMCVAWLNELTSPKGVNLHSKVANDRMKALGPITKWSRYVDLRKNDVEKTMRGTRSKWNQEDDRCQDRIDKSEQ